MSTAAFFGFGDVVTIVGGLDTILRGFAGATGLGTSLMIGLGTGTTTGANAFTAATATIGAM